jgi:Type II secretion system (T2SS), protein G
MEVAVLKLRSVWFRSYVLVASIVGIAADESVVRAGQPVEPDDIRADVTDTFLRMRILAAVLDTEAAEALPFPGPTGGLVPAASLRVYIDPRHRRHLGSARDAWGNALLYWSDGRAYMLLSLGSDAMPQFDYSGEIPFEEIPRASTGPDPTNDLLVINGVAWRGPASQLEVLARSVADVRSIATAAESYGIDYNAYPPLAPTAPVGSIENILSPVYIRALPKVDPWGNAYLYWSDATSYAVIGLASDGVPEYDYETWGRDEFQALPPGEAPAPGKDIVFVDGGFVQWPLPFLP